MNTFWRYIVRTAVEHGYSYKRMAKAFPELDDAFVKEFYETYKRQFEEKNPQAS